MGSMYKRGNVLWLAFKDERGVRVCKSSGYKVGEETAAEALLAELDKKASEVDSAAAAELVDGTEGTASIAPPAPTVRATVYAVANTAGGITVREYGEQWLASRADLATIRDECG